MPSLTQDLIDRGLQLPPDDRRKFANLLLDSIEGPPADAELQEELQRRWDRYKSGEDQATPVEEYLAELDRRIAAKRE